jgi:hypothetical protein
VVFATRKKSTLTPPIAADSRAGLSYSFARMISWVASCYR